MTVPVQVDGCTIHTGDCRDVLATLPADSVHCCVTSPPYWGLRDYGVAPSVWADGWEGCLGLEPRIDMFVAHIVEVFQAVRRVLRQDGVLWLNMGDSYNNFRSQMGPGQGLHGRDNLNGKPSPESRGRGCISLKEKDLVMMPARVALALQADGWWLRSDCIWAKPNPMPESCRDRPTAAHEHVFLLTRSARYFFDADAVAEVSTSFGRQHTTGIQPPKVRALQASGHHGAGGDLSINYERSTRNLRNVWTIATAPFHGAHFATFPPALAERCILAGTSAKGCCAACGAPWAREVERTKDWRDDACTLAQSYGPGSGNRIRPNSGGMSRSEYATSGWRPTCTCNAGVVPCAVLDPFGGSGTTGLVAARMQRRAILIEVNPEYAAMAERRIADDAGPLACAMAGRQW